MIKTYAYLGDETIGEFVCGLLDNTYLRTEALEQADAIVTFFRHIGAIEDAYFDAEGIIKKAKEGALLVDLSASTPDFARELYAVAAVNDLRVAEAPLAVVDPLAPAGITDKSNVLAFLGADDEAIEDAKALLAPIAGTVHFSGACGSAQMAKVMHTIAMVAQVLAVVEAHGLYQILHEKGLSLADQSKEEAFFGKEFTALSRAVAAGDYSGTFNISLMLSDAAAAMTAADDAELILPQLESAMHLLELLCVIGGGSMSPAALNLLYMDEASSAAAGLDWTRAEGIFEGEDQEDGDFYDDDDEGLDFPGGFSDYSVN